MQIKTKMRYHLTPVRMDIIKKIDNKSWWGCEETGTLYTISGNVHWYCHYGKQYGGSLKN